MNIFLTFDLGNESAKIRFVDQLQYRVYVRGIFAGSETEPDNT